MKVHVAYETQLRRALGTEIEPVSVPDGATVADVIRAVVQLHDETARALLLDAGDQVRASLMIFIDDNQVDRKSSTPLSDGAMVTLMSPISGG
jgi:molybdopterin converting factor small subunit